MKINIQLDDLTKFLHLILVSRLLNEKIYMVSMEFYICEKHFQRLCFKDTPIFYGKGFNNCHSHCHPSPRGTSSGRGNTEISPNSRYPSLYLPVDKRALNKSLLLTI